MIIKDVNEQTVNGLERILTDSDTNIDIDSFALRFSSVGLILVMFHLYLVVNHFLYH